MTNRTAAGIATLRKAATPATLVRGVVMISGGVALAALPTATAAGTTISVATGGVFARADTAFTRCVLMRWACAATSPNVRQ